MAASESIPNLYVDAHVAFCKRRKAISRELFRSAVAIFEISADFLTCAAAVVAAYILQLHIRNPIHWPMQSVVSLSIVLGLFAVFLLQQREITYLGSDSMFLIRGTEQIIRTSTQSLLPLLLVSLLLKLNFPRTTILIAVILIPLSLIVQRQILASIIRILHAKGYGTDCVVVYGADGTGRRIVSSLLHSPRLGLRPVAVIGDHPTSANDHTSELGHRRFHSIPVQHGPVTPALLKALQCDLLIVAISNLSSDKLIEISQIARQAGLPIALLPSLATQRQRTELVDVHGLLLASLIEPVTPWHYAVAKRMVDLALSSILLVLSAPLLFLIALLIRLDSPGPAFFVQKRVGRNGKLFDIFKFRSMHDDAPRYDRSPTRSSDPRITRIGRFLRRSSLDELPQLMNVFLGNMSLVGPRPEMPFLVQRYSSRHQRRLQVVPGITGLWQLSADRAFPIHKNIHHDLYYVRNRTFFLDLAILIHTLFFAMRGGV